MDATETKKTGSESGFAEPNCAPHFLKKDGSKHGLRRTFHKRRSCKNAQALAGLAMAPAPGAKDRLQPGQRQNSIFARGY